MQPNRQRTCPPSKKPPLLPPYLITPARHSILDSEEERCGRGLRGLVSPSLTLSHTLSPLLTHCDPSRKSHQEYCRGMECFLAHCQQPTPTSNLRCATVTTAEFLSVLLLLNFRPCCCLFLKIRGRAVHNKQGN